jgi:hypothetical protein
MSEIKIFGYILVAVLFLSIIIMPLVEVFFVYRERLMLGDALYTSCRVAAEASYKQRDMINVDAVIYEKDFRQAFAKAFAASFALDCLDRNADPLIFRPLNPDVYNEFEVRLEFPEEESPDPAAGEKIVTGVKAIATSPYRFKTSFMEYFHINTGLHYELASSRTYDMEVNN